MIAWFSWTLDFVVFLCLAASGGVGYLGYKALDEERQQEEEYYELAVRLTLESAGDEQDLIKNLDLKHLDAAESRALAAEQMISMAERYQRRPRTVAMLLVALVFAALAVTLTIVDRVGDVPTAGDGEPTEPAGDASEGSEGAGDATDPTSPAAEATTSSGDT